MIVAENSAKNGIENEVTWEKKIRLMKIRLMKIRLMKIRRKKRRMRWKKSLKPGWTRLLECG